METNLLYREFSLTCTKERLIKLSDWLNDNLDFEHGEDFDKLSDAKRLTEAQSLAINLQNETLKRKLRDAQNNSNSEQAEGSEEDAELCKTDRTHIVKWLEFMSDLIPQLPNGNSLQMQNNARRMKLLVKKLKKSLPQQS